MTSRKKYTDIWDAVGRLLSDGLISKVELRNKLHLREYESQEIETAIQRAQELGWVNDYEAARSLVKREIHRKKHGNRWVYGKLLSRGISSETAETVLSELWSDEIEYQNALRVFELELAKRKISSLIQHSKDYNKVYSSLLRRGFISEVVRSVIETATEYGNTDIM